MTAPRQQTRPPTHRNNHRREPAVVLSGPNSAFSPTTRVSKDHERVDAFGVSTFSRATPTRRPPPPGTSPGTRGAKLSGPSTTTYRCTEHTSMDTAD